MKVISPHSKFYFRVILQINENWSGTESWLRAYPTLTCTSWVIAALQTGLQDPSISPSEPGTATVKRSMGTPLLRETVSGSMRCNSLCDNSFPFGELWMSAVTFLPSTPFHTSFQSLPSQQQHVSLLAFVLESWFPFSNTPTSQLTSQQQWSYSEAPYSARPLHMCRYTYIEITDNYERAKYTQIDRRYSCICLLCR